MWDVIHHIFNIMASNLRLLGYSLSVNCGVVLCYWHWRYSGLSTVITLTTTLCASIIDFRSSKVYQTNFRLNKSAHHEYNGFKFVVIFWQFNSHKSRYKKAGDFATEDKRSMKKEQEQEEYRICLKSIWN